MTSTRYGPPELLSLLARLLAPFAGPVLSDLRRTTQSVPTPPDREEKMVVPTPPAGCQATPDVAGEVGETVKRRDISPPPERFVRVGEGRGARYLPAPADHAGRIIFVRITRPSGRTVYRETTPAEVTTDAPAELHQRARRPHRRAGAGVGRGDR